MTPSTATTERDPTRVACAHCGLPAPLPSTEGSPAFCCRGCHGAYELIRGWGLDEYYALRDSPGSESRVESESPDAYADLDDPSLLGRSAPVPIETERGKRLFKSRLSISGLHCVACVWLVERASERVEGWHSSQVNMHARVIDIIFDPTVISLSRIGLILHRIGYEVSPQSDQPGQQRSLDDNQRMLIDIAVAGFCAANAMWVAIALYAGQFSGIASGHAQILRIAGVGLGAAAVIFPGRVFFRSAWASWKTRTPHMDLPVALGLAAGLSASVYGLLDADRDVYFDSIACLVFFLLVGRWIQMRQQRRAGEAVADLIRMAPTVATLVRDDGSTRRVAADSVMVGDVVRVAAGESVPVDGVIVSGESSLDRSLLTGESRPIDVTVGESVEAGTDNLQGELTIRATAAVADTRFASLTRAVAQAAQARTPVVQLANRIGGYFVVIVLTLALVTGGFWTFHDSSRAVGNVVSLLIVACPCALALATPLAIAVAIGRLAKRRILIRDGDTLERIDGAGSVFFDKTGTLTEGRMQITQWHGDDESLAIAAAIERPLRHPIAESLCQYASINGAALLQARDVRQQVGVGVTGTVNGQSFSIGRTPLSDSERDRWGETLDGIVETGASPLTVRRDATLVAIFGVQDPIRADAAEVVNEFCRHGWRVGILSGDDQRTVDRVAQTLRIEPSQAKGELLPQDKLDAIADAEGDAPVLMIGDGVNDAAALAAADVGIALHGGAAASLNAAPVFIGDGDLKNILRLIDAARRTRFGIRKNFALSLSYNLLAVGLAMAGMITPLLAALLMPLSSVSVLAMTVSHRTLRGEST